MQPELSKSVVFILWTLSAGVFNETFCEKTYEEESDTYCVPGCDLVFPARLVEAVKSNPEKFRNKINA